MPESENLQIGDIVQLKSGSPDLTVLVPRDQYGKTLVAWFLDGEPKKAEFVAGALKKAS